MITLRRFIALAALCGTAVLAGSSIDQSYFKSVPIGDAVTPISNRDWTPDALSSRAEAVTPASHPTATGSIGETKSSADVAVAPEAPTRLAALPSKAQEESPAQSPSGGTAGSTAEAAPASKSAPDKSAAQASTAQDPVPDSRPATQLEPPVRLVSAFPSRAKADEPLPPVRPLELTSECLAAETCVDEYLWSLYERTPKVDTNKVIDRIKKAVKKDGKVKTIIKTITNYVIGDFTWKDPAAADKAGLPMKDYVIGGMDSKFRLTLYRALRALENAGFKPGITSAFRDDYRQSIADGNKAASDSSYHGGSRRGGFGHGLAADIVSVKGDTRMERLVASDEMWKWIDAHEKDLGIGRPYRDRDPPHVGPLDGKEYADKRGAAQTAALRAAGQKAAAQAKAAKTAKAETRKPASTARHETGTTKHAKSAKVSSAESLTVER